jgi:hypothetical protein
MKWRWVWAALPLGLMAILFPGYRAGEPERAPAAPSPFPREPAPSAAFVSSVANVDDKYPVDLDQLRARLPDNAYWQLGAPTEDPEALRERAEHARRMNELYGKVLSGTGSDDEIRRYYEERRRISQDYIQLSALVLSEVGDRLPDRDRGLYQLTIQMHRDRLAAIPRELDQAIARKKEQDRKREEWTR